MLSLFQWLLPSSAPTVCLPLKESLQACSVSIFLLASLFEAFYIMDSSGTSVEDLS